MKLSGHETNRTINTWVEHWKVPKELNGSVDPWSRMKRCVEPLLEFACLWCNIPSRNQVVCTSLGRSHFASFGPHTVCPAWTMMCSPPWQVEGVHEKQNHPLWCQDQLFRPQSLRSYSLERWVSIWLSLRSFYNSRFKLFKAKINPAQELGSYASYAKGCI